MAVQGAVTVPRTILASLAVVSLLVRPAATAKAPDADGFLQRWMILEPIRVPGQLTDGAVQTLVKTEHFPGQLTVLPRDGDRVKAGDADLAWHMVDTARYNVNLYHFAYGLKKPDPWPATFGYHEVFHTGTLVGWLCMFAAVVLTVAHTT